MRIVAGTYGGRVLETPKNRNIRPTSDKVRGAIFSALNSRGAVKGARVLDGFCGTGALGLEALSQGAVHCTFIDKDRKSLDLAKKNAAVLDAQNTDFLLKDMTKLGARSDDTQPFNLVFLDPPYERDLLVPTLLILHNQLWVVGGAIIVAEVEKDFDAGKNFSMPAESEVDLSLAYALLDEKLYGDTKVLFLEVNKAKQ